MERALKTDDKEVLVLDLNLSLANAIRRSSFEIKTLAIKEVEFFKNDSVLNDEILAHRIGMIPLKNERLKEGEVIEIPLKYEAKKEGEEILSQQLGKDLVAINDIPLVKLNKGQKVEFIARASLGNAKEHSRHLPGLIYYYTYKKINLNNDAKKNFSLVEVYPKIFTLENNEVIVKNEWACDFEEDDINFKNVEIKSTDKIVFVIESFGMMSTSDILRESVKVLDKNLNELKKELSK
ncbi:MAG: hypothetical protein QW103_01590 [Candidatus Pacearchaeota archaeon]